MKGSNKSRWAIAAGIIVVALAAAWYWHSQSANTAAPAGATSQTQRPTGGSRHGMRGGALAPVQAATAVNKAVPRYLTGLGTITAANTATVRSRVDGQLIAIHFQEGQQVKAGDLLAEIDPSQFKVALAQAQGQLAKDNATLANARRDLARYQQLVKTNLVSRQELDTQQSLVSETQGTIKADEAAVASAQLQLDWSRITAPIDGRVGLKQVDIGNQISSGDTTGIVVITQTHPIDLVFTLPESDIATVMQAQKAGKGLVVEAWDRTKNYDRTGLESNTYDILGVKVPSMLIPVMPGRNLAVILETAAINNRQKEMGYNAAQELLNRLGLQNDVSGF